MPYNLLFLDQFGTMGGGQRVLLETLRALDSAKYRPTVALNGRGDFREGLLSLGIAVVDLPLGNYQSGAKSIWDMLRFAIRTFYCSVWVAWSILRHRVDLLFANGPRTFICAVVAGRITKCPVVWHLHNVIPAGIELNLLVFFSPWVSRILVCSKAVSEPLLRKRPELQSKIKLLYNPLPRWDRTVPAAELTALKKDLNLQDGFIRFGIIGRITPFKGQISFIEAAQLVLQQFKAAYFFVIGSPAKENIMDQAYYHNLQLLVRHTGLESSILFMKHQTDIGRYYALLDVVVLASQGKEALPQTIIEAMSLGKAIIAPALGGIIEMLEDENTALLIDEAQPDLLAVKMLVLIHHPEKRRSLGLNAKNKVAIQFSRERFVEEIQLTVTSCLKEKE